MASEQEEGSNSKVDLTVQRTKRPMEAEGAFVEHEEKDTMHSLLAKQQYVDDDRVPANGEAAAAAAAVAEQAAVAEHDSCSRIEDDWVRSYLLPIMADLVGDCASRQEAEEIVAEAAALSTLAVLATDIHC